MPQGTTVRKIVASVACGVVGLMAMVLVAPAAGAATRDVSIVDFSFVPATLTVDAGDTVVWTNNGTGPHTVTADDGSFNSGSIDPSHTFSHTFSSAATVPYYCMFHGAPGGVGMAGRITVRAGGTTTTPQTTATPSPMSSPPSSATAASPPTSPPRSPARAEPTTVASAATAASSGAGGAIPTTVVAQLAHTGSSDHTVAVAAAMLIAIGLLIVLGARRRGRIETRS
jgi:LPXTG-motif cell wall-anchored protein